MVSEPLADSSKSPSSTHDSKARIARSAGMVALWTMVSRVTGVLRDSVTAALYRKEATDVFFAAQTIPNVLRRLVAEGSLTVAFLPEFTRTRERDGDGAARDLLANMLGVFSLFLLMLTLFGTFKADWLVYAFATGFADEPEKFGVAVFLTQVMMVFLFSIGLMGLAMGVLNAYHHFMAPTLGQALLNVVIIVTMLLGQHFTSRLGVPPITSAAIGVSLGGIAQLVMQFPFLHQRHLLVWPRFNYRHPGVVRVALLMLPSLFSLAVHEINVMLARNLASMLEEGSISAIYYAQRLIELPMGVFAVALATVALPHMAGNVSSGDFTRLKETYSYALRMISFVTLPAAAGLIALSVPLCALLFQRGPFTYEMSLATARTLIGFTIGLVASGGIRQTAPVFFALQDTKTPVKVSVMSVIAYALCAIGTFRLLGTFGLALAVSVSSFVNFFLLLFFLQKRLGHLGLKSSVGPSLIKSTVAASVCGVLAYLVSFLGDWVQGDQLLRNWIVLAFAVIVGVAGYAATAWILRAPELGEMLAAVKRRRGKA